MVSDPATSIKCSRQNINKSQPESILMQHLYPGYDIVCLQQTRHRTSLPYH